MQNNIMSLILFLLFIAGCIFLLWLFIFKVKHLKTPNVYMVDGGVKVGKSLVTVMLAVKQYRRNCIAIAIRNTLVKFINIFRKKNKIKLADKPMLYSNMPLYKVKYNPLTLDIILRKVRIPYKSVVLLDEATLIADSMLGMIKDKSKQEYFDYINESLTIFLKLYGHMTHGGSCFFNSQNVVDLHFSFKRNTSSYLMVTKNRKFPFFSLISCRELMHDESHDLINTNQGDIDDDNKPLFVSKRWYKYYDRYYLDVLTNNLPLLVDYDVEKVNPKEKTIIKEIVTLGTYKAIQEYNESMRKQQQ